MSGRLALVTGAASGIGRSIAARLAAAGLRVAVTDINGDGAQQCATALPGAGHGAWVMDVASEAQVAAGFAAAEDALGPVSVLVCSAGTYLHALERPAITDITLEQWESTCAVNLRGTFLCTREFLRRRKGSRVEHGRIVCIASAAGQSGSSRTSAEYSASKAGVLGYLRVLAREAAPMGITANAASPGAIDTPLLRQTLREGEAEQIARAVPLGRIGSPEDIAATVGFLVSRDAAYITGAVIDVNGGTRIQ